METKQEKTTTTESKTKEVTKEVAQKIKAEDIKKRKAVNDEKIITK